MDLRRSVKFTRRGATSITLLTACTLATHARADDSEPGSQVICVSRQINEFIYTIGAQDHLVARIVSAIRKVVRAYGYLGH